MSSPWLPGPTTSRVLIAITVAGMMGWAAVVAAPVDTKTPPVDKEQADQPFQGKVEAVDATARTLTVSGKVISVTAESKIKKGNNAINLSDVKVGDSASGTARHGFNGKIDVISMSVDEKKI